MCDCATKYGNNLCGWSWVRKFFFPFAWAEAENTARRAEYRLRLIEAKLKNEPPPMPPGTLRMM